LTLLLLSFLQGAVVARAFAPHRQLRAALRHWGALGALRTLALTVGSAIWAFGICLPAPSWELAFAGLAVVIIGIAVGRYAFYRFYVNVGLPRVR
jgi:DMSO reductase anchor subunit